MTDDERRAEIEAVRRVLEEADLHLHMRMDSMPLKGDPAEEVAQDVLAALDRVRDARGDDEARPDDYKRRAVALPLATTDAHCCGHRRENGDRCACVAAHASEHFYREDGVPWRGDRSPQGEDHEERLREIADLVVDVLHGRKHSGELLIAIKPYRTVER